MITYSAFSCSLTVAGAFDLICLALLMRCTTALTTFDHDENLQRRSARLVVSVTLVNNFSDFRISYSQIQLNSLWCGQLIFPQKGGASEPARLN